MQPKTRAPAPLPDGAPASSSPCLESDPAPTCSKSREISAALAGWSWGHLTPAAPLKVKRSRTKMGLYWNLQ